MPINVDQPCSVIPSQACHLLERIYALSAFKILSPSPANGASQSVGSDGNPVVQK